MVLTNRWNRVRYRLYAPVYDVSARPLERGRKRAIQRLDPDPEDSILILGAGTGADIEYLPETASVTAVDLTPAMVRRTAARGTEREGDVTAGVADAHSLPFEDDSFDAVLLHLVLSVVPDPAAAVAETDRVLASDGRVSIYDKFSPPDGEPGIARRIANPVARLLFADLNRPLEPMVAETSLGVGERDPFLGGLYSVAIARPTTGE